MNELATFCEVNKKIIPSQDSTLSKESPKNNIPVLYRDLRAAKNKAECISAMRRFIVWNDIPEDILEKLDDWSATKK